MTELEKKLMDLHDATMHQQSQSINLLDQLKKINPDSLKLRSTFLDSLKSDLSKSSDEMMDWMGRYELPKEKDSTAYKYFEMQLVEMKMISNHLSEAIQNAKKIIPSK